MHLFFHHGTPFLPHLAGLLESWVSAGGPPVVFLVTFLEGIPPIGLLAPSHTTVLFAGFLVKIGALSLWSVAVAALLGMVLGDSVGYWMGRRYGYGFLARAGRMFYVKESAVDRLKSLVASNPGKTIVLGKFNPLTRALAPFAAGASGVPYARFILVDAASDLVWTVGALALGYLFGAGYSAAASYFGSIALIGVVIIVFAALTYRFVNRQFRAFARYELFSLVGNLAGLAGFALMVQGIAGRRAFMLRPDVAANLWFSHLVQSAHWLFPAAFFVTVVGSPLVLAAAGILYSAFLAFERRWRHLAIALASLVGGSVVTYAFKAAIGSPRPPDALFAVPGWSFPSGHAVAAGMALVLACYFFLPVARTRGRRVAILSIAFAAALLIGASRLLLSVHWLSDVLAGYSLGIAWATGMILLVRYGGLLARGIRGMRSAEKAD